MGLKEHGGASGNGKVGVHLNEVLIGNNVGHANAAPGGGTGYVAVPADAHALVPRSGKGVGGAQGARHIGVNLHKEGTAAL